MMNVIEQILKQTIYGDSDSDGHLMTILGIALSIRAKRMLELGVRYGDTTLPLLEAAYLNGGKLTSVDIAPTKFQCPIPLMGYWQFVQSEAVAFLSNVSKEDEEYDLVLVDDWHSGEHVAEELYYIDKLTTPSSIILLHDLMYGNTQPNYHNDPNETNPEFGNGGPCAAVFSLPKDKWEFSTIPAFHGLTILRKKA